MVEDGTKKVDGSDIFIGLNRNNCFYNLVYYCSQLVIEICLIIPLSFKTSTTHTEIDSIHERKLGNIMEDNCN